jgi:hypothetical protein
VTPLAQAIKQVVDTKEEIVELSLTELAQVGGGSTTDALC